QTQFILFKRLLVILIIFLSVSIALLSIDDFRRIGTSLLASVGVAGIIVGLSAQRMVATFLAGIHLAIAQPIRIDDVVVAEGEWGRVEEVTFTYVVLRLWDSRRLVLPTTYFLEKPFQNWTRVSADIIGTAFFHVDFSADVEEIREFFSSVLGTTPLWDGRAKAFQVTDCTSSSMEVRALMSAANSGAAWDLRCHVRERMMEWLRIEHPDWLPRTRAEVNGRGGHSIPWSAPERDWNDADLPAEE
ncbi:MAG: mechanosensitive ion channel, partial [Synergistales bacterium]|nr:mechanosensitive ion channel [Synergistales bacterium]